jgi:hypothetical protein
MVKRVCKLAVLAGMMLGPAAWADDPASAGRGGPWTSPQALRTGDAAASPANFVQPPQGPWQPAPAGNPPVSYTRSPQTAAQVSGSGVVRLPPTGTATPTGGSAPGPAVDGTYREDGQFVTININGKEMRLIKPPSEVATRTSVIPGMAEGTVRGRLMQNGRPLANCRVVIVPLEGQGKAYRYDTNREPMSTVANAEGIYDFDHVPVGKYKLTWLPAGTNQWIRKIAIKPDVAVNAGQAVTVNTIGTARQTIN